jgi:transglutaminase-like putative cysteine protease
VPKTRFTVLTALALAALSAGVLVMRRAALGEALYGPPAANAWRIALIASGQLRDKTATVVTLRPPDFRHQHVFAENFQSADLFTPRAKSAGRPELVWHRAGVGGGPQAFWLRYGFQCLTGMRRPTPDMARQARVADAAPARGEAVAPTPQIPSDAREVSELARELVAGKDQASLDEAQAFFDFVAGLETEPPFDSRGTLDCLRRRAGSAGDKSRLLVALCRNRGIPTRLLAGLILRDDPQAGLHYWAEAWVEPQHKWHPMCPTHHHFGPHGFPKNYFVWNFGEDDVVRCPGGSCRYGFTVQEMGQAPGEDTGQTDDAGQAVSPPGTTARSLWLRLSLYNLRPSDQQLVRLLLLLPLSALIVSVVRTVIGVPTFGTFAPALLGLAFLDRSSLPWGPVIFVLTVMIGWGLRRVLDRYHLLQVPRVAAMLTLIVAFLIVVILVATRFGVTATHYIKLFPLVILTHLVERFWTVETEDGTATSFKTLLGTLGVALAISLALGPPAVATLMFNDPELLGVVLASQLLLGRYTGYRLSELYRFRDLAAPPSPGGGAP